MDPTILDKPLTEGAGQLRVISRLALRAAMKEDKLTSFWQEIEKIFPVTSDQDGIWCTCHYCNITSWRNRLRDVFTNRIIFA